MGLDWEDCVIATTGDFGWQRNQEMIRYHLKQRGAKYSTELSPDVTHLVCSLRDYKLGVPIGV